MDYYSSKEYLSYLRDYRRISNRVEYERIADMRAAARAEAAEKKAAEDEFYEGFY